MGYFIGASIRKNEDFTDWAVRENCASPFRLAVHVVVCDVHPAGVVCRRDSGKLGRNVGIVSVAGGRH